MEAEQFEQLKEKIRDYLTVEPKKISNKQFTETESLYWELIKNIDLKAKENIEFYLKDVGLAGLWRGYYLCFLKTWFYFHTDEYGQIKKEDK